jgi:hypothetical protein
MPHGSFMSGADYKLPHLTERFLRKGLYALMSGSFWRCSQGAKRFAFSLAFCTALLLPVSETFAHSYMVDAAESQSLTTYLRQNRLPLVGAQVLADGAGNRRIVLYGFVATDFGKTDAARKALAYVGNGAQAGTPAPQVENRIEVRPEIARMKTQGPPNAATDSNNESLDRVLDDIDRYGVTMAPAGENSK